LALASAVFLQHNVEWSKVMTMNAGAHMRPLISYLLFTLRAPMLLSGLFTDLWAEIGQHLPTDLDRFWFRRTCRELYRDEELRRRLFPATRIIERGDEDIYRTVRPRYIHWFAARAGSTRTLEELFTQRAKYPMYDMCLDVALAAFMSESVSAICALPADLATDHFKYVERYMPKKLLHKPYYRTKYASTMQLLLHLLSTKRPRVRSFPAHISAIYYDMESGRFKQWTFSHGTDMEEPVQCLYMLTDVLCQEYYVWLLNETYLPSSIIDKDCTIPIIFECVDKIAQRDFLTPRIMNMISNFSNLCQSFLDKPAFKHALESLYVEAAKRNFITLPVM
jgi:hypothetical protein